MVVPDSHWVTRAPWYSGPLSSKSGYFRRQGYHLLWPAFPDRSANILIFDLPTVLHDRPTEAYNTEMTTHTGLTSFRFGLFPFRSPLLGESLLISLPVGTEMFHFPTWASHHLCIQWRIGGINRLGFPIRKSSDHGLLAAPRGLSQLATSFFAC